MVRFYSIYIMTTQFLVISYHTLTASPSKFLGFFKNGNDLENSPDMESLETLEVTAVDVNAATVHSDATRTINPNILWSYVSSIT